MFAIQKCLVEAAAMRIPGAEAVLGFLHEATAEKKSHKYIDQMLRGKYYQHLHRALEEVSQGIDAKDAAKKGGNIGSKLLSELSGLKYGDTKEQTTGKDVVEYDMRTERGLKNQLNLLQGNFTDEHLAGRLWKNPIKYCFDRKIADSAKKAVNHGLQHIMNFVPCMKFEEVKTKGKARCDDKGAKALYFKSSAAGCWSFLGKPQYLSVTEVNLEEFSCDNMGIAVHETLHALGMLHEQSRTDHKKFITIHWDNILPSKKGQYMTTAQGDTSVPYDIMSIMHYPNYMFAYWGKKSMTSKVKGAVMGNRMGMTKADALQLGKMYGCEASVKKFNLCVQIPKVGIATCTKGDCICHQDPQKPGEIIKVPAAGKTDCFQCVLKCPDWTPGRPDCGGCGAGYTLKKTIFEKQHVWSCESNTKPVNPWLVPFPLPPGALAWIP